MHSLFRDHSGRSFALFAIPPALVNLHARESELEQQISRLQNV